MMVFGAVLGLIFQGHERPAPERVLRASQGVSPQCFGSHTIGAERPANLSPRELEFYPQSIVRQYFVVRRRHYMFQKFRDT